MRWNRFAERTISRLLPKSERFDPTLTLNNERSFPLRPSIPEQCSDCIDRSAKAALACTCPEECRGTCDVLYSRIREVLEAHEPSRTWSTKSINESAFPKDRLRFGATFYHITDSTFALNDQRVTLESRSLRFQLLSLLCC